MNNETMKAMFERLNDGTRIGNNATDKVILAEQPETQDWNENRDGYFDYMSYANGRIFNGFSHEDAVKYVEKQRKYR